MSYCAACYNKDYVLLSLMRIGSGIHLRHRLKAGLDSGLWTLDSGPWTLDSGLWTLDSGLWTLDSGLWTLDAGLWTLFINNF